MHHWAVPISLHVLMTALMGMCPRHLAHFHAVHEPLGETLENKHEVQRIFIGDQVHERVSQIHAISKIHRQVHEIVESSETLLDKNFKQHALGIPVRNVAQHHRGQLCFCLFCDFSTAWCSAPQITVSSG